MNTHSRLMLIAALSVLLFMTHSAIADTTCEVPGCAECNPSDPTLCNSCRCGYVINSYKDLCSPCRIAYCESCDAPGYGNTCGKCRLNYKKQDGGKKCVYSKPGLPWYWIVFIVVVALGALAGAGYFVYRYFFKKGDANEMEKLTSDDRTGGKSGYGEQSQSHQDGDLSVDSEHGFSVDDQPMMVDAPSVVSNPLMPVSLGQQMSHSSRRINDADAGGADDSAQRPLSGTGSRGSTSRARSWAVGNDDEDDAEARFF